MNNFVVDLLFNLVMLKIKQHRLLALYASLQMQNLSIFICHAYVPSNLLVFMRHIGVLFCFLSYIFTQSKLHADGTSWNGCFAVVHLSRFTLQVVPFVADVHFLRCYFNSSSMGIFPD